MALLALGVAGCANIERSRDLSNPEVPPTVTAMQVCAICHGVDGNSTSPNFPKLAGQSEEYFVSQMKAFRDHSRSDPAGYEYMWGLSRNLTDEQIAGLAAYFAKQPTFPASAEGVDLEPGKNIYDNGVPDRNIPACKSCHGPNGAGSGQFPRLAGQHADYLVKQLLVFSRTDERPEGSVMKAVAHDLTMQDVTNVSAYLSTVSAD